jgi:hypothetical protein
MIGRLKGPAEWFVEEGIGARFYSIRPCLKFGDELARALFVHLIHRVIERESTCQLGIAFRGSKIGIGDGLGEGYSSRNYKTFGTERKKIMAETA